MKTYLPRNWLFGHPEKSIPKISPNGKYISYLAPDNHNLGLIVQDTLKKNKAIHLNTDTKKYSIEEYEWAYTNHHLIYWHDEEGDENWGLYSIDLITQKNIRITPNKTQAKIIKLSSRYPDKIAILINNRNPALFDVCVVNIVNGQLELIYENRAYIDIYVDHDFTPKVGIKPNLDGSCQVEAIDSNLSTPFTTLSQLDFMCHYMFKENRIGLNQKGDAVFFAQSIETDKAQLVRYDLNNFTHKILAANPESDYQDIILDKKNNEPIAVAFNYHKKNWQIISDVYAFDLEALVKYRPNHEFSVISQSEDNTLWLIEYNSDTRTPEYCLYSTKTKLVQDLFFNDSRFNKLKNLATQQCLTIPTQDKLNIPCYFSIPSEDTQKDTDAKIPLVLWIHGGPNSRDFWGFNPIHQWLTNRGYAVLSVNFRGSTGFGRAFLEAGNGEWGGKIAEDIKLCAEWVSNKYTIINKNKIAIMGRSFGGYSALMGLAKYPDFYACAADWVGPTNLNHFLENIPSYWKIVYDMLIKLVGDTETRLAHSPEELIHQFKKPLLKAHGAHDVRVNQTGPDIFVQKLAGHLSDLYYATFPNEGHCFKHENNKIAFYALVEAFAAKYLGGGSEPIHQEIANSALVLHKGKLNDLFMPSSSE